MERAELSNMGEFTGISRRSFLAGASIGAIGLAAASMVGCSPQSKAPKPAQSDAKSDSPEITETVDTDVLVIGAGVSGITAAVSAADNGAKVVVIDQLDGLTKMCGHSITAVGTSFQQEAGEDWTPEQLVDFWNQYNGDDGFVDREAQLFAAEHSAESIYWLMDHGVDIVGVTILSTNPFQYPAITFVTSADTDGIKAYLEPLKAKAEKLGAEFHFSTEATKLLVDANGAVTGAEARSQGKGVQYNAKSVIVAAGGFGGSQEYVRLYAPLTPNLATIDGDMKGFAISQAQEIGADMVMPGGTAGLYANADGGYMDNPGQAMYVNMQGKRWVNENLYNFDRAGIGFKLGISQYWAIYDSPLFDELAASTAEKGLESGSIVKADTVEDLARLMGINAATFKSTVDEYNGYCDAGVDAEFGKPASRMGRVFDPNSTKDYELDLVDKDFVLLNKIATPPFYGINMNVQMNQLYSTQGGVRSNTNGEVLDVYGNAIPNLYAVGESSNGHLIGFFYPQGGVNLCMCFCFGRYAGAAAAANAAAR